MAAAATFALMVMALAIVLAVGVGVVLWAVFGKSPYKEACCGRCRYAVEGLEGMTCPECGADLRRVGIFVPGMRWETGAATRATVLALVWTCGMAIAWVAANTLMSNVAPGRMTMTGTTTFSGPPSGLYSAVDVAVDAEGENRSVPVMDGDLELELRKNGDSVRRTLALADLHAAEDRGGSSVAMVRETLLEMAEEVGADSSEQVVRAELEEVAVFGAGIHQGNSIATASRFSSVATTMSTSTSPVRWPFTVVGLASLLIWSAGMAWIIMWGRKRRRIERERWGTPESA